MSGFSLFSINMIPATRQNQVSTTTSFPSLSLSCNQPTKQSTLAESKPRPSTSKRTFNPAPRSFVLEKRKNACQVIQESKFQIIKIKIEKRPRTPNSSRPPNDREIIVFRAHQIVCTTPSPPFSIFRVLLFVTAIAYRVKEERWRTTREENKRKTSSREQDKNKC